MNAVRKEGTYLSVTGLSDIFYRAWLPADGKIKAVVQIAHGMAEHGERYADFAGALCENGYAVYVNDHIGHGKSVTNDDVLGYFGEEDGWKAFTEDAKSLTDIIKAAHPGVPVILYGHSMGSFVARRYVTLYGDQLQAAVFCGTSGPNPAAGVAVKLANAIAARKGSFHKSRFIDKLAFGSYNKKYGKVRTVFDWLTRDAEIVDRYIDDFYCGFLFTAKGYQDMFTLLQSVSTKEWAQAVPTALPILIVSGRMDPVGNYGKGTTAVYQMLKDTGHNRLTCKLYDGARHEILNEINRKAIYNDIIAWLNGTL